MIADPEGPSFIVRTVEHRRYSDGAFVTHDPHRSWLMLGHCDAASRCGVDKSFKARAHFRWVDTTRCLHPLGYGERIKPLQASFARANESATQAPGSLVRQSKGLLHARFPRR